MDNDLTQFIDLVVSEQVCNTAYAPFATVTRPPHILSRICLLFSSGTGVHPPSPRLLRFSLGSHFVTNSILPSSSPPPLLFFLPVWAQCWLSVTFQAVSPLLASKLHSCQSSQHPPSPPPHPSRISAPGLKVHPDIAVPWKIALARFLSAYIPKLPIPPKMPTNRLYSTAVHERDTDALNNLIGTRVGFAIACVAAACNPTLFSATLTRSQKIAL
jgi:hypothetical protein